MKFKKIEINGFKSFADKIDIPLSNGVTAIVGPNGCGKSNVADAIRWALGEQSAKLLRGGCMQDVIFNGTEKRLSHSFCEVSLYFDNSDKIFKDLDYKDVVFTRKLFRSNESEYQINKATCRRADIIDALRDSGIGKEGYSIIGQGKVDELILSKPEDRRAIFDEAAGISKFKAKKLEAERRLAKTSEHLVRIDDILGEKSKQLEPLTRQSETARKYLDFSEVLKNLEVNIYLHQYDTANEAKRIITDARDKVVAELNLSQKEYEISSDAYNEAMQKLSDIDGILDEKRKRLLDLSVGLERNNGEITVNKNSMSYLIASNEKLHYEITKFGHEIEISLDFISQYAEQRPKRVEVLASLKEENIKISGELHEIINKLSESMGEEKESHRTLYDAMERLTDIKSNMSRLLAEKSALEKRVSELDSRSQRLCGIENERNSQIVSLQKDTDGTKQEFENSSVKFAENNMQNSENLARLSELNTELGDINARYFSMAGRQKLLNDIKEDNRNFEESVTRLLNCAKNDTSISEKIEGVVARVLSVPKSFEYAIETAIGSAMNNIITRTEAEAAFLIDYLKKTKLGRVTFLPMSVLRPRTIHKELLRYLDINGCYGIASKLVKYDDKFGNVVENLLGGTVVVDSMNTAIALAKTTQYAFNIVTIDGDIIRPSGAITGGSRRSNNANLFSNERELKELNEQLTGVKEKIDLLEIERAELVNKQEIVRLENKTLQSNVHSLEIKLSTEQQQMKRLLGEKAEADISFVETNHEIAASKERIQIIMGDVNSVEELERIIQSKKQSATESTAMKEQETADLRSRREQLNDASLARKIDIANRENDIANLDSETERIKESIQANRNKISLNKEQIAVNETDIEKLRKELEILMQNIENADIRVVKVLNDEIENFSQHKAALQTSIATFDEQRNNALALITQLQEKRNAEDYKLIKVDTDIEMMQERIAKEYNMEYRDCIPFRDVEFQFDSGKEEADKLRRRIDRLGPINLEAIEMCEQVYGEYSKLGMQRDDLTKAQNDLTTMIDSLSKEMRTTFKQKFSAINENFKHIFRELFDGGSAELILQDEDGKGDLNAGVEIVAQPPQKKLQILSLLSGGEKALTAIAILFAILKLSPMPFCVLDEIEAALDDANAMRFAKYLRRFSKDTQFIVITHRKPTMELADTLYGVTMQEKGVSRVVSVKLSEAVTLSDE